MDQFMSPYKFREGFLTHQSQSKESRYDPEQMKCNGKIHQHKMTEYEAEILWPVELSILRTYRT